MDVTRRCDYACRILRVAYNNNGTYTSVADIAEQEGIPYAFARSIQHDLVKGNLVKTVRGAHGGLALSCDPSQVTLLEVLETIQGPLNMSLCVSDFEYCDRQGVCEFSRLWAGADRLLAEYFSSITLKDLIDQGGSHPIISEALEKGVDSKISSLQGCPCCISSVLSSPSN